jgi:hypothetical protein
MKLEQADVPNLRVKVEKEPLQMTQEGRDWWNELEIQMIDDGVDAERGSCSITGPALLIGHLPDQEGGSSSSKGPAESGTGPSPEEDTDVHHWDDETFNQFWEVLDSQQPAETASAFGDANAAESHPRHPKKNYPAGVTKQFDSPAVLKQLDLPNGIGNIKLDPHVHRFCANYKHSVKENDMLVPPYTQGSFTKTWGTERTWQVALAECHGWLWTKFSRLHQYKAKFMQKPCTIDDGVLQELETVIASLPFKIDYCRRGNGKNK